GDDIMYSPEKEVSAQLIEKYNEYGSSVIGVQEVDPKDVSKYGVIKPVRELDSKTVVMSDFVEKPNLEDAPSLKACLGRYLLTPDIFEYLENTAPGKGGEIQLTDGILAMMNDGKKVLAYNFDGIRYDIGNKIGLLKANIEFGLRNPETSEDLKDYLKNIE
ncbi:MAG: sugar phosphate nucleotidyltransferase, partial [Fusobacteriaceae bacterium]